MNKTKLLFILFIIVCTTAYSQSPPKNFKGTIKNNSTDSVFVTSQSGQWRKGFAIDASGNFSGTVQQGINMFYLLYADTKVHLFLQNTSDLNITADANDFVSTINYEGTDSAENNFIADNEREEVQLIARYRNGESDEEIEKAVALMLDSRSKKLKEGKYHYFFKSIQNSISFSEKRMLLVKIVGKIKSQRLEGKPSPQFSYTNYKGGITSLADLKGKYVYIDVWATWCGPCRQQIPFLQQAEEKYKDDKIAFVSISIDAEKDLDKWRKLVEDQQLGGIQLMADKEWKSDFITAFGIKSIPRFILVGPDGNVVDADAARPSDPELDKLLGNLLK